jgi:hypothetical protein
MQGQNGNTRFGNSDDPSDYPNKENGIRRNNFMFVKYKKVAAELVKLQAKSWLMFPEISE